MRQHAQLNSELSMNSLESKESAGEVRLSMSPASTGYTYHPKWGYREKKERKPVPQTDAPPPHVSVTVNKTIMDALGKETGTKRVGVFLQVLLRDWVEQKRKGHTS
jgi:hypothetical protein